MIINLVWCGLGVVVGFFLGWIVAWTLRGLVGRWRSMNYSIKRFFRF
jgi:NhaP-type Na+/H+ or K+/H+ antiporter